MINLPSTILIGPFVYTLVDNHKFREKDELQAQIDHANLEIKIRRIGFSSDAVPEVIVVESLIHEILHGLDYISAYAIFDNKESSVITCSMLLLDTLLRNPAVLTAIQNVVQNVQRDKEDK